MRSLISIFIFIALSANAQVKHGSLLLLKVTNMKNTRIEKLKNSYFVLNLDSIQNKVSLKPVLFQNFTDSHLQSCKCKDSIRIKTLFKNDTFKHENYEGINNANIVDINKKKMKSLVAVEIKSELYNQKIIINYTLIKSNYCIGKLANYDSSFIGYDGEIVLIIDDLKINNEYKLSNEILSDIIDRMDYNLLTK